mmetsp:Transcript_20965/g.49764  ORF Transcript_20965/g.49764 Transcript_20965/m.49764 type:complete len:125 (+) Transcript_20965:312-686(+)
MLRAYDPERDVVLGPRLQAVPGCQVFLNATCRWTSQLHYHQFLPAERVAGLLEGGADVHSSNGGEDAPTPIGLARARLIEDGTDERAKLILEVWSPVTHARFSTAVRARVVELLLAGHLLARSS